MKSTRWTVTAFARKVGRSLSYFTLGLGPFNVEVRVKGAALGPQELQRALEPRLAKAGALELAACRPAAEVELTFVHLDLAFREPEAFTLAGLAPLVVERLLQPGGSCEIAYSPLRPADFFVVDPLSDLDRQANRFFAVAWQGLAAHEGAGLLRRGHERIVRLPFKLSWRALPENEAEKPERIGSLKRRREPVLDRLATAITSELAFDPSRLERLPRQASPLEQRLATLLGSEPPPSFAFIGPSGCGKSAQIEALAARLLVQQGFLEHGRADLGIQVYRLIGRRLISGMSYFGQWEQRCLDLIDQCRELRLSSRRLARDLGLARGGARPPIVLWVDDLAAWGQIGRSRDSSRCLADVFLTPLRRGELLLIGEATPEAFALLEDDAPAFAAHFQRVELQRPDAGKVLSILLERSRALEDQGSAPWRPAALRGLIETTPALYGEDAHPGFSCRLLDQAAEETPAATAADGDDGEAIDTTTLLRLMARESGLPQDLLRPQEKLEMATLRGYFSRRVLGQDEAVETVCELILTLKAGLQDPRRPPAVLLFTGPTGTGKTELAKALAAWLYGDERRLLRFDMGEHADPGAVARLVGERGRPQGLLTEALRAQPFAVLLFDEIEKAHRSVLHLLLQVFEDGRLTDAMGELADFRQAVLILTSNLGAAATAKVGLKPDGEAALIEARQAAERFFAPELFNRIDRIVTFRPLSPEIARRIAAAELYRIFGRRGLAERGVFVRTDETVIDRIRELGFDQRSGARGVKRFLEREIVVALTEALAQADPAAFLLLHLSAPAAGSFAVAVEAIEETAALATDEAIDRLYELPPSRLLDEIPDWLSRLETLHREQRDRLEQEQSERLRAWQQRASGAAEEAGQVAAADALHDVDQLRGRLLDLRLRLEAEIDRRAPDDGEIREAQLTRRGNLRGERRRVDRRRDPDSRLVQRQHDPRAAVSTWRPLAGEEMVALVGEILWLEYAARSPGGQRSGQVTIELSLLSEHRPRQSGRLAPEVPSLQQELVELLLEGALTLEGFAAEEPAGRGKTREELFAHLAKRPRLLRLEASGTLLAERLAGDIGSYVRVRSDGNQEIVRIEVFAGKAATGGAAAGKPKGRAGKALPLLQLIHFEPPPAGEWVSCRVEDFGLCLELERPARRLQEVLQPLRRRRQMAFLKPEAGR